MLALAALALARAGAAQEPAAVVGRVLDAKSGAGIPGAEVTARPAGPRALANEGGWFVLTDVADGAYVLEVGRVGYATARRELLVAGEPLSLEIRLAPSPIGLDGVEVVGAAARPAYEVGRIDLTAGPPPAGKAIDLLRRVVGAQVFRGSGEPGAGASVSLRGPTSIASARDPLVVVDGVATSLLALQEMRAADIATVEVLKGPAAAAEYGSRGQAGVILITTRRGREAR